MAIPAAACRRSMVLTLWLCIFVVKWLSVDYGRMPITQQPRLTFAETFRGRLCLTASFGIALLLLAGCGKSGSIDEAPRDIRGEPIHSAATNRSASASASTNGGTTKTVSAATSSHGNKQQQTDGDFVSVGFDKLAGYTFEMSDDLLAPATNDTAAATAKTEAQIPATIKALNKKRVAVQGFMLPLKVEGGVVTEMLIMKDQSMCCYGVVPKINEWISIKMVKDGVKPIMDQPVTLYGTLRVGEMRENGYLVGIYGMDGETMAAPTEN